MYESRDCGETSEGCPTRSSYVGGEGRLKDSCEILARNVAGGELWRKARSLRKKVFGRNMKSNSIT